MPALFILLYIVETAIASYLLQPSFLLILYWIGKFKGVCPGKTPAVAQMRNYQFGIIITAHNEADFIPAILDSLLKQTYPFFNVYVVADACNINDLHYSDRRIRLLSPLVPLNSQTASLEYGFRHFQDDDEICVIFDPDNLVHPRFLEVLNTWYNAGYLAVQGYIKAKNQQGVYSQIDGFGMQLGNFIDRISRSMFGLSASICGCGVSVHRRIYEKITYDRKSFTGGFDKHMQVELVMNAPRIGLAADAIFYDEKVDDGHNFEQQRTRWIASYFKFFGKAFQVFWTGLKRRDFNLAFFGYNLLRPPYFLLLFSAFLMLVTGLFVCPLLPRLWLLVLGTFTVSFIAILSLNTPNSVLLKNIVFIPLLIYRQIRALFKWGAARKVLLKTSHSKVMYIEELLGNPPLKL
jgi:cellulose synthase/poly-beta-1,6-N-acetylglucosamine synthase-like glycosyltransferase